MCLPVWRESKLGDNRIDKLQLHIVSLHVPSRLEGIETQCLHHPRRRSSWVYMCLPVWRESKPEKCFPVHLATREVLRGIGLHVPSRLEGIETIEYDIFRTP